MSQLQIITTPESIKSIISYLNDKDIVTYDTETTGVSKYDQIIGYSVCAEDDLAYYVVLAKWNKHNQVLEFLPGMVEASRPLIEYLKTKSLVMHNSVFDCMITESFFKIRLIDALHTDTMVLAHLLDENRRIGLKELASDLFGESSTTAQQLMKQSVLDNGGQLTKSCYEMYKADYQLMAKYGAQDALLTYKLFNHLLMDLLDQNLQDFFYNQETMPLLKGPTYDLNTTGLSVDVQRMSLLKKTLESECLEAKAYIYQEIDQLVKTKYPGTNKKNIFNIGSSSQLSWLLFGELGLEFGTLTKEGKTVCKHLINRLPYTPSQKAHFIGECIAAKDQLYNLSVKPKKIKDPWSYIACDKATLKKLSPKHKWIEKLLEYQRKMKLLSTYVEGIEERTKYGVIHPSFLQTGTTSGRYSSRNPNFQNLPRDDQRIKECIKARQGKVFVLADYSQLEPRVFAYVSQDPALMAAFNGTDDFYSVIGMGVYDKTDCSPQKEGSPEAFGIKYKKLRDLSKVIALASTYGATAHQLAPTTGKSIDDTQLDIDKYFSKFQGVAKMMTDSHELAKSQGYVTNIFGRPRRMPEAMKINKIYGKKEHKDLPYEARSLLNLAVNHRIQSTGASIMNRAAIAFHNACKEHGIDAKIVIQIHDELGIECNEADADTVVMLLQHFMENTTVLPGVPLEAIPRISKTLAK